MDRNDLLTAQPGLRTRLTEQWLTAAVERAPLKQETRVMTAFVQALRSFLALYGFGDRGLRKRPAPVSIGRSPAA